MIVPAVDVKEFEKYGFKQCKNIKNCYYLCISRGCKMIFVSPVYFDIMDWDDNDPRIHSNPNCKYRDKRTALEVFYDLIQAGLLIKK